MITKEEPLSIVTSVPDSALSSEVASLISAGPFNTSDELPLMYMDSILEIAFSAFSET
ncbi:hypothetical protein [Taylorella equigenitalis]|uniref:hypothetical protein n=1 Tax=Taylorella equigenitalis TaxID=29575 RepID=UPI00237EE0DC|nr:hypothetical protein [Taylorella equigenitalis]